MTRHRPKATLLALVTVLATTIMLAVAAPASAHLYEPGFGEAALAWEEGRYREARPIFEHLASEGDARAQYYLGVMHANGQAGPRDLGAAARWYRRAAEQDHAAAAYNLAALLMQSGDNLTKDVAEAARWYQVAAEGGLPQAANNLGILLQRGEGVATDMEAAFTWFRRAADQGYAPAVYNVAVAYTMGQGVARDYGRALTWMLAAARLGHAPAENAAARIAETLDDETAAAAERRVVSLLHRLGARE